MNALRDLFLNDLSGTRLPFYKWVEIKKKKVGDLVSGFLLLVLVLNTEFPKWLDNELLN
jgi:hypothetical protein